MAQRDVDIHRSLGNGVMKRIRDGSTSEVSVPPPPPPPATAPWYGNVEEKRDRLGTAPANVTEWWQQMNTVLRSQVASPPPNVSTFMHGYSGSALPATFQVSSVKNADTIGIGAMLNVKRPWAGLAAGAYNADIVGFFNSWPVGTFGSVTINHEPENDGPSPASPSNSAWVTWANANGPIWRDGVNQFIDLAAPIIRARGLDVKVGGCLMDFSWDPNTPQRFTWFNWWDETTPANRDVVSFMVDAYWHANSNGTMRDHTPRMTQVLSEARSVGITSLDLFETNFSRAAAYGGSPIVASAATQAAAWQRFATYLNGIPEIRMVSEFHLGPSGTTPGGFASQDAWLAGSDSVNGGANNLGGALDAYADIALAGNRTGVTGG